MQRKILNYQKLYFYFRKIVKCENLLTKLKKVEIKYNIQKSESYGDTNEKENSFFLLEKLHRKYCTCFCKLFLLNYNKKALRDTKELFNVKFLPKNGEKILLNYFMKFLKQSEMVDKYKRTEDNSIQILPTDKNRKYRSEFYNLGRLIIRCIHCGYSIENLNFGCFVYDYIVGINSQKYDDWEYYFRLYHSKDEVVTNSRKDLPGYDILERIEKVVKCRSFGDVKKKDQIIDLIKEYLFGVNHRKKNLYEIKRGFSEHNCVKNSGIRGKDIEFLLKGKR